MKYLGFICWLCASLPLFGQVSVTYPWPRSVFQRSLEGVADIPLSGEFRPETSTNQWLQPAQSSVIEARLIRLDSLGFPTTEALPWQIIIENPSSSIWTSSLPAILGGWYHLEVRWRVGETVRQSLPPRKVGVGEVFVVAGQSNAQGEPDNGPVGTLDDRVNTFGVNAFYANNGNCPDDIITPITSFVALDASTDMALFGYTAWAWGKLGENLARRLQVPILFINAATGGSTVRNWRLSADGLPTNSIYTGQQYCGDGKIGYPFKILKNSLHYFSAMLGTRAILWHQGEADNDRFWGQNTPPMSEMRDDLIHVIQKSREAIDYPLPWVVSRVSYVFGTTRAEVIQAQNEVIQEAAVAPVFPGPETDVILPREDDLHFDNLLAYKGLDTLAAFWDASLTASFFTTAVPFVARLNPILTYSCTEIPGEYQIQAPATSTAYRWVRDNNPPYGAFITSQTFVQMGVAGETYRCYVEEVPGYWRVSASITLPEAVLSASIAVHQQRISAQEVKVWASGCAGKIRWVQTLPTGSSVSGSWGVRQDTIRFAADQVTTWYAACQDLADCQTLYSQALTWDPDNCAFSHDRPAYPESVYKAQSSIISGALQTESSEFSAGKSIVLTPGFQVNPSTVFQATVGGCVPSYIEASWPPCQSAENIVLSGLRGGTVAEFRISPLQTWRPWSAFLDEDGISMIEFRTSDWPERLISVTPPTCP